MTAREQRLLEEINRLRDVALQYARNLRDCQVQLKRQQQAAANVMNDFALLRDCGKRALNKKHTAARKRARQSAEVRWDPEVVWVRDAIDRATQREEEAAWAAIEREIIQEPL
jgi:RNA polymerase-binding transcription factor DksA